MSDRKLKAQRYRLWMADDTEHEVRITNADMVAFDRERARHRSWPSLEEAPFLFANYVCWRAATRMEILNLTLSEFEEEVVQLEAINDDEDNDVDPTPPVAAPTWSSPSP